MFADRGCSARPFRGDETPAAAAAAAFVAAPSSCTRKGEEAADPTRPCPLAPRDFLAIDCSGAGRAGLLAGTNSGEGNRLPIVGGEL